MTPPQVRREHWGFDDPAKAKGTEEEVMAVFRRVRDEIEERIRRFTEETKEFTTQDGTVDLHEDQP